MEIDQIARLGTSNNVPATSSTSDQNYKLKRQKYSAPENIFVHSSASNGQRLGTPNSALVQQPSFGRIERELRELVGWFGVPVDSFKACFTFHNIFAFCLHDPNRFSYAE